MSILDRILATKREEVARARSARSQEELAAACREQTPARSLADALRRPAGEPVRFIAEVKRASPSAGPIRPGADPVAIAREYEAHGASAVSVLTDVDYFDGALEFLPQVAGAIGVPVLRKDFVIDPYQVYEARANAADAVLLIVAALDDDAMRELLVVARGLGMDALVEAHSEEEAERGLAVGATVLGVNHRNLHTFEIDTGLTGRLRKHVPEEIILVGESGIRSRADVEMLAEAGADALLVGESLMRAESPGRALAELAGRDD